ncbi:dynamin family protein [Actibacterium ureilyticum]|uniref:dynamin family protein n=1 Tax=Actibacterium ureilyticum TaxID=1590614 RepID=UPI000BAAE651|nr:dynamin family protein [Actibacterium ureilyticum]
MTSDESVQKNHGEGFEELNAFWDDLSDLEVKLQDFSECALSFVEDPLERVLEQIRSFEPSVSVIGQIKAGKSTLMNALVGKTDLLPSDVNPWTSVITSVHLNSRYRPPNTRALFRFFDQHEWDRLVATGGRLGEMADRAGFETEVEEVRAQVTEMRQTTEERLGDEFNTLIGSSHAYPEIEKDTVDRYICYGDPDELAEGADEGVYADLTKSADLYLDLPGFPQGLCLRDTPGVNDTFMMREQITLNAISDSRVCVVVLSAHQALSTMDVALLRIICSVEARDVLIFVNRIDELPDPVGEQAKIRSSISRTLNHLGVGDDIEILFGSGYWANCALGDIDAMMPASKASLERMNDGTDLATPEALRQAAMEASGIPALHRAIANRVVHGQGLAFLRDIETQIENILSMSETVENVAARRDADQFEFTFTSAELSLKLADIRDKALGDFDTRAGEVRAHLRERLERAQMTFVASAVEALQSHLETFGETGSWDHDPTSLRMMMKTGFNAACAKLRREGESAFDQIVEDVQDLLQSEMGVFREGASIEFPEQAQHKPPTVLARTLSLDLQGTWWRKFWRFGKKNAAEKRYREVIISETTPLIEDLLNDFFDPAIANTREVIENFAMDQSMFCKAILESFENKEKTGSDWGAQLGKLSA